MDLLSVIRRIDTETARAFVQAARHVVDAMLLEAERMEQTGTPTARDYNTAALPRDAPAGGWLSHAELRQTARELSEAIAAEKWVDGVVLAIRLFGRWGG